MKITKPSFIVLLVFLSISSCALSKEGFDPANMHEWLSEKATRAEYLACIEEIEQRIKENPNDCANYEMLAFVCDYLGFYEKALEAIKQQIKYAPKNESDWDVLYGNLAKQYLQLDRLDDAKVAIDKALEYNPKNLINHQHLLDYYFKKKQYKEVSLELKIMSDIDRQQDFYYDLYQYASEMNKDRDELLILFKECVKVNPQSNLAHRALAVIIRNNYLDKLEENFPVIMQELNKALELDSKHIPTYISIADTYLLRVAKTKNEAYYKDALDWFNKAYKIEPQNLKLAYAMGNLFIYMEQYDNAIEKLKYAMENGLDKTMADDSLAHAYNNKAYSFYKAGDNLEKGLELIEKALNLRPNNGVYLGTKAEILYKMEKFDEAYEYIKKAIALEPGYPEMEDDLKNIEKALKTSTKSKTEVQKAGQ